MPAVYVNIDRKIMNQNWIDETIQTSLKKTQEELKHTNPVESLLLQTIIDKCYELASNDKTINIGHLLASGFDLLVSADYYSSTNHKGWFYCREDVPRLFYNFTNCCPRHALKNQFYFNPSNKLGSGKIGKSTSRLLRRFLSSLLTRNQRPEQVLSGSEPVDLILVNAKEHKVFFAEIKASPLVTLPISSTSQRLTAERNGTLVEADHIVTDNTAFFQHDLSLFVPDKGTTGAWRESYFPLGQRADINDEFWAFRGIIQLLQKEPTFLRTYFTFWNEAMAAYHPKHCDSIYWLSNSCGAPSPRPDNWPKARKGAGVGFETVSDSKTSVGMDRTDDIKKGIYQVLKLGSEGKPLQSEWDFKVGMVSNIHPARHYLEYLESIHDLIWTIDETGKVKVARDLPADQNLYNLFDAIITLTNSFYRDDWLATTFAFLESK